MISRRTFVAASALALAGCAFKHHGVTVGSKNFTEQLVLGELLAQYLAHFTRVPLERRFYLAGTYICQQAILADRIDLYVEYTGTALAAILKQHPPADRSRVYELVRDEYARKFQLAVLPSLGFNNSFAMVMRGKDARRLGVTALSQLAGVSPQLRIGIGYEFLEREDGYKGLVQTYGLEFATSPRVMDLGLLYRAIQNNEVDVVAGSNTDGLIAALDLVVMDDDRHYFPPYDAVPVIRQQLLQSHPELQSAIVKLSGRISAEQMRRLNYNVDGEKKDPVAVVSQFLQQSGLLAA